MNPVLLKDLLGFLRLRRVAAIQVLFVLVLAGLVLATWPQGGVLSQAVRGEDNLLLGLVLGQLVLLVLFVPGVAAVSMTNEREANTLEMLYASRLSPARIIIGKLASAVSFPVLLLLTGLPFLGLLGFRGGVAVSTLVESYAILATAALFLAILSLTISALCKQSSTALVIAYVTVLMICGGVLVPAALMLGRQTGPGATLLHYTRSLSPMAAVLSLLRPADTGFDVSAWGMPASWQIFLPVAAGIIVACLAVLVWKLGRAPIRAEGFGPSQSRTERSIGRRIMFLIDPRKQRRPIGIFNPVMVKESRTNSLLTGPWMIRIFYASLLISFALSAMSMYGGVEHPDLLKAVSQVIVAFQIGVVALVTPSLSSPAISFEIESNNFEMLRLTPLRAARIFWGKFLPSFVPALLPIVALVPAYVVMCYVNTAYIAHVVRVLPIAVVAVVFCSTLGIACSSFTANTARATVAAYLIAAAVFVLPMFAWWASGDHIDPETAKWLCMPSPLVMALNQLPDASTGIQSLWAAHLKLMGGLCVLLLVVARIRLTVLLRRG